MPHVDTRPAQVAALPPSVVSDSGANLPLITIGGTKIVNAPPWQAATSYPAGFVVRNQGALLARKTEGTSEATFVLDYTYWEVVGGIPTDKVWLQDPTLTGTIADNTNTTAVDAVLAAALVRSEERNLPISGLPGTYKCSVWDKIVGTVVAFVSSQVSAKSIVFKFATDTGRAPAIGVNSAKVSVGATSIELQKVKNTFLAATPEAPQKAVYSPGNNECHYITYTGITGSGETVTLTGVTGVTVETKNVESCTVKQGYAFHCSTGPSGNLQKKVVFGSGIMIEGPNTGSLAWKELEAAPTTAGDGVTLNSQLEISCEVRGFRMATATTNDHQAWGETFTADNNFSAVCFESPQANEDRSNQIFKSGAELGRNLHSGVYVTAHAQASQVVFEPEVEVGNQPRGFYKEKTEGVSGALPSLLNGGLAHINGEGLSNSLFSSPDGLGLVAGIHFLGCIGSDTAGSVALFDNINVQRCTFDESPFLPGWTHSPYVKANTFNAICPSVSVPVPRAGWITENSGAEPPAIEIRFADGAITTAGTKEEIKAGMLCGLEQTGSAYRGKMLGGMLVPYAGASAVTYPPIGLAISNCEEYTVAIAFTGGGNEQNGRTVLVRELNSSGYQPSGVSAAANATAGNLAAVTYYYKVVAVLSGGGLMTASAEVSATPEVNKSVQVKWTAPATIPHGQTITHYRVFRGTEAGKEKGYHEVGEVLELIDSVLALTGATEPPAKNTGCEIYGNNVNSVRAYGHEAPGCACVASGPADTNGAVCGMVASTDNGATAQIRIMPRMG